MDGQRWNNGICSKLYVRSNSWCCNDVSGAD